MSTLIVVRHGQASFLADNYDQLSELGWEQARRLGEYWAQHEIHPTALVVGPRQRHRETAEAVTGALLAAGVDLPDIVPDDRLDEFDWDGLMMYANSTLAEREPDVADLRDRFHNSEDLSVKRRTIQHYMESVMHHWVSATFHEEGLETWAEFRHRVETALHLHTAFSRAGDPAEAGYWRGVRVGVTYVQDVLEERKAEVGAMLYEGNASLYVCGDGKAMATDVHHALRRITEAHLGVGAAEAEARLAALAAEGRYTREIWN